MFGKGLLYGAAYYPEHWDKGLWGRDAELMAEAGFNMVRVAEFAWWNFEPREGEFAFGWLDDALDVLDRHDIRVIVGTPTATIPPWMAHKYPDVMRLQDNGQRARFGVRKDYCVLNSDFDRLSMRIVEQVARHYADDLRVFAFQTDNEFCGSRCYCQNCLSAFHDYLHERYGTVEHLNDEWGTWFWGMAFNDFAEVPWPAGAANPSLHLEARRFWSRLDVQHQAKQIAILRRFAPDKPITHNMMGLYSGLDYYDLARELDFASWDNYPGFSTAGGYPRTALAHAVMHSTKRANFLVMEQQSGPGGWLTYSPATAPGEQSMLAWQSVARGADGISYFRWRTSVSGQEQYWHGILNHDNRPSRRCREVAQMGADLRRLEDVLLGTRPQPSVGIYNNYEQIWATDYQPQNGEDRVTFGAAASDLAYALAPAGVDFGVFGSSDALGEYKLVLCPPLYLGDPAFVAELEAYVQGGGRLVLMATSGQKTVNNKCVMAPLPGVFSRLAGVEVEEYALVPKSAEWQVELPGGTVGAARIRECLIPAEGTRVAGVHRGGYMDGAPAVTHRKVGRGDAWYVGCHLHADGWLALLRPLLEELGVRVVNGLPAGVEVCRREGDGRTLTFVLNHNGKEETLPLPGRFEDLLGRRTVEGALTLAPYGVAILDGRL
jgi:beta-galactosidase